MRHSPKKPAGRASVAPPAALNAAITQINLFGQNVDIDPAGGNPITGYLGQPLYVTGIAVSQTDSTVLVFTIDDVGPPVSLPDGPTTLEMRGQATVLIRGLGMTQPYETAVTQNAITYTGAAVVLTATWSSNGTSQSVIPAVQYFQTPDGNLNYVMIMIGNTTEIRWIDNSPVYAAVPKASTPARVIPPVSGAGVVGPFGLETP